MLTLEHLTRIFNRNTLNQQIGVSAIDLHLTKGSFLVVVGTGSSGKTTLINLIAGTEKPDSGRIIMDEQDITHLTEYRRAKFISRVRKDPRAGTAPNLTVAENLALALNRKPLRRLQLLLPRTRRNALREQLAERGIGLEDHFNREAGLLSDGYRQALTLIMATMIKPQLLLLDEHTSGLDQKSADMIIRLTNQLIVSEKLTTIMVTDSMYQAIHLGDRLIMMHHGRVIDDLTDHVKKHLRVDDLNEKFEEIRRLDSLDSGTAKMLENQYI